MKNNIVVIILVVIVGILSGISLLLGIGNSVSVAVGPLTAEVGGIAANQRAIIEQLKNHGGSSNIEQRLTAIEQKLNAIEQKLGNGRGNMPNAPQPPQEDFNKVYTIDQGQSPSLGENNAPVTIVEFSDFQCPFCARFHAPLKEALAAYPKQVRLIIKNFPLSFHPNARPAAKLALAANEQKKYFEMVDLLLQNGGAVTEDKIKEYAKALKLNYDKLMADYKNKDDQWEARIKEDLELGGKVEVHGTPTYFINGRKTMARDLAGYKVEIDKILAQKK